MQKFKWGFCASAKSCGFAREWVQSRQYPFWSNVVRRKNKQKTQPLPKRSAKSLRKSLLPFFFLLIQVYFLIYQRKFGLTCRVQIALTHFAPPLFHLVSLCFNLWKHLFWDGLALGDSFGPGIAHITAILNLTKPDCSKGTFGLGEIGYSSSSISLRSGTGWRQRQLFMFNSEVGQSLKCF